MSIKFLSGGAVDIQHIFYWMWLFINEETAEWSQEHSAAPNLDSTEEEPFCASACVTSQHCAEQKFKSILIAALVC